MAHTQPLAQCMTMRNPCPSLTAHTVFAPHRPALTTGSTWQPFARRLHAPQCRAALDDASTSSIDDEATMTVEDASPVKPANGFRRQHTREPTRESSRKPSAQQHKWYKQGEHVVGKVTFSNNVGAKVRIFDNDNAANVVGWLPASEVPYVLRAAPNTDPQPGPGQACVPKGLVREFQVMRHQGGRDGFRGPLLSARSMDWDMLWRRAEQLLEVARVDGENITVRILDVNSGGLLTHTNGLRLFIPVSHLERSGPNDWWSEEEMHARFVGKDLEVAVVEVDAPKKKLVGSVIVAKQNNALRRIKVGALVEGTVRRVESFGAFVGLEGTHTSGLIHISNVSRAHVNSIWDVFQAGDRVKAVVMAIDEGYTNISLSTAELEADDGDVINNPGRVWDLAETQLEHFQEHIAELQAELRTAYEKQQVQGEDSSSSMEEERTLVGAA